MGNVNRALETLKRISEFEDRNLEMIHIGEQRELRSKKEKKFYKNYLTPLVGAT